MHDACKLNSTAHFSTEFSLIIKIHKWNKKQMEFEKNRRRHTIKSDYSAHWSHQNFQSFTIFSSYYFSFGDENWMMRSIEEKPLEFF